MTLKDEISEGVWSSQHMPSMLWEYLQILLPEMHRMLLSHNFTDVEDKNWVAQTRQRAKQLDAFQVREGNI